MLNRFNIDSGNFIQAWYREWDPDTKTHKAAVEFTCKQPIRVGKNITEGETEAIASPLTGLRLPQKRYEIETQEDLNFIVESKVIINNTIYTVLSVSTSYGVTNSLALSRFKTKAKYASKTLLLG